MLQGPRLISQHDYNKRAGSILMKGKITFYPTLSKNKEGSGAEGNIINVGANRAWSTIYEMRASVKMCKGNEPKGMRSRSGDGTTLSIKIDPHN